MSGNAVLNIHRQGGIILLIRTGSLPKCPFLLQRHERGMWYGKEIGPISHCPVSVVKHRRKTPSGRKCILKLMFPEG